MAEVRFIQRHSLLTRIVHDTVAISCVLLMITGLFVFVTPLANIAPGVTRVAKVLHRIIGVIFICAPIIGAVGSPVGVKNFFEKYLTRWTPEDFEFLKKFVPYMLMPKRVHMPDQDEVKSGQRFADGALIIGGIMMAVSGLFLWLGSTIAPVSAGVLSVMRFIHDLFFLVLVVFVVAHAFLGGGMFQPYRGGTIKLIFGNGQVSEANALYHWGFWAREEIEKGTNIVVKNIPDEDRLRVSSKASLAFTEDDAKAEAQHAHAEEAKLEEAQAETAEELVEEVADAVEETAEEA